MNLCTCGRERLKKTLVMGAAAAQPVVNQKDLHTVLQALKQYIAHLSTKLIGGKNVHFNANGVLGLRHRFEPSGEVFTAVEQTGDFIVGGELGTGGTCENMFGFVTDALKQKCVCAVRICLGHVVVWHRHVHTQNILKVRDGLSSSYLADYKCHSIKLGICIN